MQLCLLSGLLGENRDIFFPKLSEKLHLITFSEITMKVFERRMDMRLMNANLRMRHGTGLMS